MGLVWLHHPQTNFYDTFGIFWANHPKKQTQQEYLTTPPACDCFHGWDPPYPQAISKAHDQILPSNPHSCMCIKAGQSLPFKNPHGTFMEHHGGLKTRLLGTPRPPLWILSLWWGSLSRLASRKIPQMWSCSPDAVWCANKSNVSSRPSCHELHDECGLAGLL